MKTNTLFIVLLLCFNSILYSQGAFSQFDFECQDGVARPYVVYSPKDIDQSKDQPLLVYLHGAISRKNLTKDPLAYAKKSELLDLADKGNFHLMFCFGQKNATWFDEVGTSMVLGEIDKVKNRFKIDATKVFLSGFSDGGSGALYFSMTHPFSFAGFISMNGNFRIASKVGFYDLYPGNMNDTPIYIINTKKDRLYPISQINPSVEYLKKCNSNIIYSVLEGDHKMSYINNEQEKLIEFIQENKVQDLKKIEWETSDTSLNNPGWLKIIELDTIATPKAWHQEYQLDIFDDKADFGLVYDYTYQKKGVKVKAFQNDSCTARKIGIEKGDIILKMEERAMTSVNSPYYYTVTKKAGEETTINLIRNGEEIELKGIFNKGRYDEIFKHKSKSGKISVNLTDDKLLIQTSRIAKISIDFDQFSKQIINELVINNEPHSIPLSGIQIIKLK